MNGIEATDLNSIVHVIQTSLSPIFLLSAVSTLLSVFTTRLARISDQVKAATELAAQNRSDLQKDTATAHLTYLRRRIHALDTAVVLAGLAGALTCGTVLSLFLGTVRSKATVTLLLFLFGAAILCTIAALAAFLVEVLLASRGIRAEVTRGFERVEW